MRRDIFPYTNAAGKELWADPLEIDRRLKVCCGKDPAALRDESCCDEPLKALAAGKRLAWAACQAFGLGEPWDPEAAAGVLEAVWRACLEAFLEWREKNG